MLRRLLIVNDISRWQGPSHPHHVEFQSPSLSLEGSLLSRNPSYNLIEKLVLQHKDAAIDLDEQIKRLTEDSEISQDFMRLLLEFYISRCDPKNPLNLVVIDNLDQLPTGHIEAIIDELQDVASDIVHLPILVPLRPSSVANRAYKRQLIFCYHYGPNNFEVVLHRLTKYILGRSRRELIAATDGLPSPWVDGARKSSEEVTAFLFCAYLYALVLIAGRDESAEPEEALRGLVHKDHSFLFSLSMSGNALRDLAGTLNALVGKCCRYALDQAHRFFNNFYSRPLILRGALSRLGHPTVLPINYGNMVYTLIAENPHPIPIPRVSNLFLPARTQAHPHMPSLAKLRILTLLRGQPRVRVKTVASRLCLSGIPLEATLDSLNSLHNKFRLLVWFSKNKDLKPGRSRDLSQDVVLSEHGHEYFTQVLGNFEYVWYCATELAGRELNALSLSFPTKLQEYLRLVDLFGDTEWKQITFHRSSRNAIADFSEQLNLTEMLTLRLLYSTLSTAVSSAEIALGLRRVSRNYRDRVEGMVWNIANKIRIWEERYEFCYGGTGYLLLYRSFIERVGAALASLNKSGVLSDEASKAVVGLVNSWSRDPVQRLRTTRIGDTNPPTEDLVTLAARYGRGIPMLKDFVQNLDRQQLTDIYLGQYLRVRRSLRELLAENLPTYSEVVDQLRLLLLNLENVVNAGKLHASTGAESLRWFIQEEQKMRRNLNTLERNAFSVPKICREDAMSDLKRKANNILSTFSAMAVNEGVGQLWHLSAHWRD